MPDVLAAVETGCLHDGSSLQRVWWLGCSSYTGISSPSIRGLELQGQIGGVVPALVQVAAMDPEVGTLVGFHILRSSPLTGP